MLDFWRNLIDAGLFAAEVQGVIALRLMRLASGGYFGLNITKLL
jgi:hypothetical protein